MKYINTYASPLGQITLASDDLGLTGLWFDAGEKYGREGLRSDAVFCDNEYFEETRRWLDVYFSGRDPGALPRLHLTGSDFRKSVGRIMCRIPYGQTSTYGEIARMLAEERGLKRMSAQAVGGAVGHNPISIIVPCHRIIGADGSLTGYGGGIQRKVRLLKLEGAWQDSFYLPAKGTAL